jgi:hypothetical protein
VSVEQRWVTTTTNAGPDFSQIAYIQHPDRTYEAVCPWCAQTLGTLTASLLVFTTMKHMAALQESHFTRDCPYFLYWQRGGALRLAVCAASPRG